MNVVLVGYRCSGKSSTSQYVAAGLGWPVIHTDREIAARAGQRIVDIVRSGGWKRFRELEMDVIKAVTAMEGVVVDAGGSVVAEQRSVTLLRARGRIVWLRTSAPEIRSRMEKLDVTLVPLTMNGSAIEEVDEMLQRFDPLYEAAADYVIDTGGRQPADIAAEILKMVLNQCPLLP
ncbi:MAG TPA: shikimate kinase [Nitrospiraceae bacterium]|nr:shikimate kinase [Nitrospiraceae bacterium]